MKKIQLFLLQFLLISITQHTNAQLPVKTEYTVEMGGTSGKGTYVPMWLTANRQGLSSANTENGYLRAGIAHTMPLNQHDKAVQKDAPYPDGNPCRNKPDLP